MKYPVFFLLLASASALQTREASATPSNHPMPLVEVVSTTRDSGWGSLRVAIESANRNAKTRIIFQIPGTDTSYVAATRRWSIAPLTPLPILQKPDTRLECDGSVVVSGVNAGVGSTGLRIEAPRCQVSGLTWDNWSASAISIRASDTRIENNEFRAAPTGIAVEDAKSRHNRFASNQFEEVPIPIALRDGSNEGIAAPTLTIERQDIQGQVSHVFTLRFRGKPNAKVTVELDYSSDESHETPQIKTVRKTTVAKADATGNAVWQFSMAGYPAGSWTALATQNGNTSAFSRTVVMPYLV